VRKILFLIYGLVAYLIFLGTFLYAIGFVSALVVPRHIDSEPVSSFGYALLINASLLSLFAVQHSAMARPAFKRWWTTFVPVPIERSTYVLFSSICLALLTWAWQPMGGVIWRAGSETFAGILTLLGLSGFGIAFASTLLIDHLDLFGVRQVWCYFKGKKYEQLPFETPVLYKHVRHPLYLGFIIAFWVTPHMTAAHLFFAVMTTLYILVGIRLEERDLIDHFGAKYTEYKGSTPMLIPFTGKNKKN
jgi:protein-S-isoprenylcysteine O-methyltransferase Ste14